MAPQQPCRHCPPGAPAGGEPRQLGCRGWFGKSKEILCRQLQRPVSCREHIGPSQRREQVDFSGPRADARQLQQSAMGAFVIGGSKPRKVEAAAGLPLGQCDETARLGSG